MKNFIITILAVLVLCLGGYIVYDKVIDKDESSVEENTSQDISKEKDKSTVTTSDIVAAHELLKIVSISPCGGGYRYEINVGDMLYYNDLSDNEKFNMAYQNIYGKNNLVQSISKSQILESYNDLFGNLNHNLPSKLNLYSQFATYELTSGEGKNDDYYKLVANGGGCVAYFSYYLLNNITVTRDILVLDVIYVNQQNDTPDTNPKSYLVDSFENPSVKLELPSAFISNEEILEIIKDYKDKFVQYRFTFKSQEDHYIFESIKRIN